MNLCTSFGSKRLNFFFFFVHGNARQCNTIYSSKMQSNAMLLDWLRIKFTPDDGCMNTFRFPENTSQFRMNNFGNSMKFLLIRFYFSAFRLVAESNHLNVEKKKLIKVNRIHTKLEITVKGSLTRIIFIFWNWLMYGSLEWAGYLLIFLSYSSSSFNLECNPI